MEILFAYMILVNLGHSNLFFFFLVLIYFVSITLFILSLELFTYFECIMFYSSFYVVCKVLFFSLSLCLYVYI